MIANDTRHTKFGMLFRVGISKGLTMNTIFQLNMMGSHVTVLMVNKISRSFIICGLLSVAAEK